MALANNLMRGLKDGQSFWLMEQTPSITASREVNPVKRPGVMRLWSWQAIAHGADATLFFQMRQSRGAWGKHTGAGSGLGGRTATRPVAGDGQSGAGVCGRGHGGRLRTERIRPCFFRCASHAELARSITARCWAMAVAPTPAPSARSSN